MTSTAPAPSPSGAGAPPAWAPVQAPNPPAALRAALVLGAVIAMADATIVAVALDPLSRHFGASLATAQAVLTVYLVAATATTPLVGRIADRIGRRTVYLAGFGVFAAGSVLAALAPGFGWVVAGRVVQAAGGGALTSGSLALMSQHTPRRRAGRGIALLVLSQAIAGLLAPPLGGLLVSLLGWQSVFWAGVPLCAAGVALTLVAIPPDRGRGRDMQLDLGGAAGLAALLLGAGGAVAAAGAGSDALGGVGPAPWLVCALAGLAVLAVSESRAPRPILDARLLLGRFGGGAAATFLSTGTLMSSFALLPYWLEDAHGASAVLAGIAFLPIGAGIAVTSRRGGRLGDGGRTRDVTVAGMGLAAAGLALCAVSAATRAWPLLGAGLLLLGLGNGLFSSPNTAAAMAAAPRAALAGASGLLSTARSSGVILGIGATGAAYTAMTRAGGAHQGDRAAAVLFAAAAALCVAVAAIAARLHRGDPAGRPGAAGVE